MKVAVSVLGKFHAFELAAQLHQRNALAQLLTTYPARSAASDGVPTSFTKTCAGLENFRRAWSRLPRAIQRCWNPQYFRSRFFDDWAAECLAEDADVFVGWSGSSLRTLAAAKAAGLVTFLERSSSHMLHQHALLEEEYRRWGYRFQETHPRIIERELEEYQRVDYISVPSQFVKRTFLEKGVPARKLVQIPLGVNLAAFQPTKKNDDVFRIIFAGALSLQKGAQYLLQAYSELKLKNAELWLMGSLSPEIAPLLRKCQSESAGVQWLGTVPQAKLFERYGQGSVFCLPSLQDGFAMVVPQAMACELPIICTENTGAGELFEDGKEGFRLPIRDVPALKAALLRLYERPEEGRAMGRAARQRAQKNLSWNEYGRRAFQAYQTALEERHLTARSA